MAVDTIEEVIEIPVAEEDRPAEEPIDIPAWYEAIGIRPLESNRYKNITPLTDPNPLIEVHKAYDSKKERDVVLRRVNFLKLKSDASPEEIEQAEKLFERQIRVLPHIDNEHLAKTYGVFYDQDEFPVIVREYIDGQNLETLGAFKEERIKKTLADIADGVSALHQSQVIHRDIKPSNVIVTPEGKAVVTDFDFLSKGLSQTGGSTCLLDAFSKGYLAPEGLEKTTPQVDVYSLGALGINLATGRDPLDEKIRTRVGGIPVFNFRGYTNISDGLAQILEKAVNPDENQRYQTMKEFGEAISGLGSMVKIDQQLTDYTNTPEETKGPHIQVPITLSLIIAGIGLAIVSGTFFYNMSTMKFKIGNNSVKCNSESYEIENLKEGLRYKKKRYWNKITKIGVYCEAVDFNVRPLHKKVYIDDRCDGYIEEIKDCTSRKKCAPKNFRGYNGTYKHIRKQLKVKEVDRRWMKKFHRKR